VVLAAMLWNWKSLAIKSRQQITLQIYLAQEMSLFLEIAHLEPLDWLTAYNVEKSISKTNGMFWRQRGEINKDCER
jgi:hypothetical protein